MRIGVLAESNSWHFLDLHRAGGDHHEIISISYRDLWTQFSPGGMKFYSAALDLEVLDRLIVRTMPRGSLQQIVFRMDLLGRLESAGVKITNRPKTIETAVDKYLSLCVLAKAGIAVPPTAVAEDLQSAMGCFERLGGDVVYKPIFGSMGRGIVRLSDAPTAARFFQSQILTGQVIYLQKFIDHGDWDIRVLIVGTQMFAMKRQRSGHWLTNIAQGAVGISHTPNSQEAGLAKQAAAITGCDIAGIDIFYDAQTGTPMVCDINAAPGWKATSSTLGIDVAKAILEQVARPQN